VDWRRYELEQLIRVHNEQVKQLWETAITFEDSHSDAEDREFAVKCKEFASLRTERIQELNKQLMELPEGAS
jgi:hypothetical protein